MEVPNTQNEVPAYMNELIPFRCPKCGNQRRFATLRELRLHLQNDHSFQMGFIKPHVRANIFDNDSKVRPKHKLHKTLFDDAASARAPLDYYQKDNNVNRLRESSPLLETFKKETAQLELELEQAKQQEVMHKAESMRALSNGKSTNEPSGFVAGTRREYVTTVHDTRSPNNQSLNVHALSDIQQTLGTLNREVMASRINQWTANDALYKSHEVIQDMENAADRKCQEQKDIIRKLLSDMKDGDNQMLDSYSEQQKLQRDRHRLFDETERLAREADEQNHELRAELHKRSNAIEVMNNELDKLKRASLSELNAKDKDLKNTRERMKQLEWERDRLIQETEKLVRQADEDNQQLRQAIRQKEDEITTINNDMNKMRSDHQKMLEQTMSVHQKSEENKKLFKSALQVKEDELQEAMRKIAEMSGLQKQLMEESKILTEQADENTFSMQRMLNMKEGQVKDVVRQLEHLRREKETLEENTASLAERADSSNSTLLSLKEMVKNKEKELKTTQTELQNLKIFLKTAADKERVARQKLEVFIEDLLKRAETAESELRSLRSQSRSNSSERIIDEPAKAYAFASTDTMAKLDAYQLKNDDEEESHDETERLRLPRRHADVNSIEDTRRADQHPKDTRTSVLRRDDLQSNVLNVLGTRPNEDPDAAATHPGRVNFVYNGSGHSGTNPTSETRPSLYHTPERDKTRDRHTMRTHIHPNQTWLTAENDTALGESFGFKFSPRSRPVPGGDESPSNDNTDNIVHLLNQNRRQPVGGRSSRSPDTTTKSGTKPLSNRGNDSLRNPYTQRNQRYAEGPDSEYYHEIASQKSHNQRNNSEVRGNRKVHVQEHLHTTHDRKAYLSESENSSAGSDIFKEGAFKSERTKDIIRQIKDNIRRRQRENRQHKPDTQSRRRHNDHQPKQERRYSEDIPEYYSDESDNTDRYYEGRRKYKRERSGRPLHKPKNNRQDDRQHSRSQRHHPRFDSRYPETHKSMVNLKDISPDSRRRGITSREKRREREKRSRSASAGRQKGAGSPLPRYPVTRPSRSTRGSSKEAQSLDDKTASNVRSDNGEESQSADDVAVVKVEAVSEYHEVGEDPLNKMMDDNGILWEDDTLPDVSDSEFDRVSPSGSEAINRKTTCPPPRSSVLTKTSLAKTPVLQSPSIKSDISNSMKASPRYTPRNDKRIETKATRVSISETVGNTNKLPLANTVNRFVPIKESAGYKSSLSDKDMTSGGREVHNYMKHSPSIAIEGSIGSGSYNSASRSFTSRTTTGNTSARRPFQTESANTIATKRTLSGSRLSRPLGVDTNTSRSASALDLEAKIKSINDKYKQRRQDIVENKGFNANDYIDKASTYSPLNRERKILTVSPRNPLAHRSENDLSHQHYPLRNTGMSTVQSGPIQNAQSSINIQPGSSQYLAHQFPSTDQQHGYSFPQMIQNPYQQVGNQSNLQNCQNNGEEQSFPYLFPYFPQSQQHGGHKEENMVTDNINTKNTDTNSKIEGRSVHSPKRPSRRCDNDTSEEAKSALKTPGQVIRSNSSKASVELKNDNNTPPDEINETPVIRKTEEHGLLAEKPTSLGGNISSNLSDKPSPLHVEYSVPHNSANAHVPIKIESTSVNKCDDIDTKQQELFEHEIPVAIDAEDHVSLEQTEIPEEFNKYSSNDSLVETHSEIVLNALKEANDESMKTSYGQDIIDPDQDDVDSVSVVGEYGMFAEPILDESSLNLCSSMHSLGAMTDTDADADTDSVRRDFYESSKKIKELLHEGTPGHSDGQRASSRNTLSTTSSQASFDMLDAVPKSRREDIRRRRQALYCIFKFLDTQMLCRVASVCREWRLVTKSPKLWQRVELRSGQVTSKFLFHIARRCSQLKVLIMEDVKPRNRKKTENLDEYTESIQCSLEIGYEQILKKSEGSLHTIKVVNCGTLLSSKCLWTASCYSRMLKHVTFQTNFDPVTPEVMWALGSGCRELQTLDIKPILPCQRLGNFTTRCVQLIGKCFRDLETLTIGGRDIDMSALVFIVKQCQKLQHVECYAMSVVTMETIEEMCREGLRMLRTVHFNGTPVAADSMVTLYENCSRLEWITVHLTVNDYFQGTAQSEDLKKYSGEVKRFDEVLEKHPRLRSIVRLHVDRSILSQAEDQAETPQEAPSFWDRLWN